MEDPKPEAAGGMPRWVKVSGLVAAGLVVAVVLMLALGGGEHGPGRHMGGTGGGGHSPSMHATTSVPASGG